MKLWSAESDLFKCLILSDKQSQTQKYSLYSDSWRGKEANPQTGEAMTREWGAFFSLFLLEKLLQQLIDYKSINRLISLALMYMNDDRLENRMCKGLMFMCLIWIRECYSYIMSAAY